MITVATNDHYTIAVDEAKNRIHFTMKGSWIDDSRVAAWIEDLRSAIKLCRQGFTELIDWRQSTAILLTDRIEQAQKVAMEGGLFRAARLYDKETFVKHQMDSLSGRTGFPVQSFYDEKEALAWLDGN